MGHDISAYLKSDKKFKKEIAYNRRGAFNPVNIWLYEALDCVENNYCGVSGCGTKQKFSIEEIKSALEKIETCEDAPSLDVETKFFKDCINADDGSGFVIHFY